jgi:DNA-binding SARP family transcriptional activator
MPIELGREVADLVPDTRFVVLEGNDHFAYLGDVDAWMDEVERWVTGEVRPRPPTRHDRSRARVEVLGRFTVTSGGREIPTGEWGSRRARTLLKRLVVARGRPVARDELIELLWPGEFDPPRLGARLSVQLSAVRRVLDGGVIADRQAVALDLDHVETDLEQVLSAERDADVLDAYGGELLPEDRYEEWTLEPREHVRSHIVLAARRELERARAEADLERAVSIAHLLLDLDRYDDAAHRALVETRLALGDRTGARRAHDLWRDRLAELDLEVPPWDDLVAG